MRRRHGADSEQVAPASAELIERLCSEGLLEECRSDGNPEPVPTDDPESDQPFVAPVLERYTDMQYFLLLDPIHETADTGWPHIQASDPSQTAAN
jgi:hypothetical protein